MDRTGTGKWAGLSPINPPSVYTPPPTTDPNAKRVPRKLVLCFDGTGNEYKSDGTETNILKIFRFLDRDAGNQCE